MAYPSLHGHGELACHLYRRSKKSLNRDTILQITVVLCLFVAISDASSVHCFSTFLEIELSWFLDKLTYQLKVTEV